MAGNMVAAVSGAMGMNILGIFVAQLIVRDEHKGAGGARFLLLFSTTAVIVVLANDYLEGGDLQGGIVLLVSVASNAMGIVLLRKDIPT